MDDRCFHCGTSYSVETYHKESSKYNGLKICRKHRNQLKNNGSFRDKKEPVLPKNLRKCEVCDSKDNVIHHKERYLCRRHYDQLIMYGEILERTVFDKNEIVIKGDYAEVVLYNGKNQEVARAIIDRDDVDLVSQYKWGYDETNGYATSRYYNTSMHRYIMNAKGSDIIVDHKNRNKLDNRRGNLRIADKSLNAINADLRTHNTSGVTGVSYSRSKELWRSYINYKGNRIDLGWFKNKDDAIKSRLKAELKYYPDHPPQKELIEEYIIDKENK